MRLELGVGLDLLDQLEPADMCGIWMSMTTRSGAKARARSTRLAAVAHRLGFIAVRAQQVAEQLQIEFVVLDNEDFLSHRRHS